MERLIEFLNQNKIEFEANALMCEHTTFKIGGPAKVLVEPNSKDEIANVIKKCNELGIRYIAIGNGSNLLVADEGIDACVIHLGSNFSDIRLIDDETIYAQAGASLMKVCRFALQNELSGLEFAYGIPGYCGGASFMNAGAYGGEMKDVLQKCEHIDANGNEGFLLADELDLSYRHSAYEENGCIITGIYLKLQKGNKDEIKTKMDDLIGRRHDKQPIEFPSAGSTFKRPEGYFAAALIDECGLKGATVGGAQVSKKHAGFVINIGGATCKDVLELCEHISKTVLEQKGVELEKEIKVTK